VNVTLEPDSFRRIVVTLDGSAAGPAALDIAVRLAAALDAQLEGVFVEDVNLVRLADLPFLREVRAHSLVEQAISAESLLRDLRVLARQAEQTLLQAAAARGVSCSFRTWRGHTGLESLSSSFEADILTLGGAGARAAYRSLSLLPRQAPRASVFETVDVLFGDTPQGRKALVVACHLAANLDARINVLLPADAGNVATLEGRVKSVLAAHGVSRAVIMAVDTGDPQALVARVGRSANRVVVVGGDNPLLRQGGLARWRETLAGPLLVVR